MPEGPSIVILKEEVQQFKGKKVTDVSGNLKDFNIELLQGKTIKDFKTWGKHFLICFPKFTVRIHLMMFGDYEINNAKRSKPRLGLHFSNGELNFYACSVKLIEEPLDDVYDWSADIMNDDWDGKAAIKKLKAIPDTLVCDALMDQDIFSGLGNIIKNEVLFRTKIHPKSKVADITPAKLKELVKETSNYAFDFLKWKKVNTLKKHWLAYTKKVCPRDGDELHKEYLGKTKRRTYFCDSCQKLYK